MLDYTYKSSTWSDDKLIFEVSHRRPIASYITSLTLTAGLTVATMGGAAPFTLPIGAFKAYKIESHKSKLEAVRAELARRNLSTAQKRKRDVLVPVAVAFTAYVVTFSLADMIDIVPSNVQGAIEGQIESATGHEQGTTNQEGVGNKYEAFILAEAASPLSNAAIHPTPPKRVCITHLVVRILQ
ncbi:hypothetical protein FRC10_008060 [Ceratobasidium sp. 414]|nr:hypothetical protein FRC10_008060 [Ceratobasidium sp. 414]